MTTYQALLKQLANGQQALTWDAWLVLTLALHEDPLTWRESYQSLEASERDELLRKFYEDAGTLGDAFVWLVSREFDAETDPANHERLQLDTLDVYSRHTEQLRNLRDELVSQKAPSHIQYELDLAEEIKNLEEKRIRLQMELYNDPEYVQMVNLEAEIKRLEEYRSLLDGYDKVSREALLKQLQYETEALRQKKNETENAIKEAVETKERVRNGEILEPEETEQPSLWQKIVNFFKGASS